MRCTPLLGAALLVVVAVSARPAAAQMSPDAPGVGDPVPDVSGFAADGTPFALTRLSGKHAVIVFGCLT